MDVSNGWMALRQRAVGTDELACILIGVTGPLSGGKRLAAHRRKLALLGNSDEEANRA